MDRLATLNAAARRRPPTRHPHAVAGLEAGLVPLREFPVRQWFYATPLWYFHRPAITHRLQPNARFWQLVDPSLREICRAILRAGLLTTPSCQGHYYPRSHFASVWRSLDESTRAVRNGGAWVRDSETDQPVLFRDPLFALPWKRFEDFFIDAAAHQSAGYLGLALPRARTALADLLAQDSYCTNAARIERDAELSDRLGVHLFGIHVAAPNPEQRDAEWTSLTHYLIGVLREPPREQPHASQAISQERHAGSRRGRLPGDGGLRADG